MIKIQIFVKNVAHASDVIFDGDINLNNNDFLGVRGLNSLASDTEASVLRAAEFSAGAAIHNYFTLPVGWCTGTIRVACEVKKKAWDGTAGLYGGGGNTQSAALGASYTRFYRDISWAAATRFFSVYCAGDCYVRNVTLCYTDIGGL